MRERDKRDEGETKRKKRAFLPSTTNRRSLEGTAARSDTAERSHVWEGAAADHGPEALRRGLRVLRVSVCRCPARRRVTVFRSLVSEREVRCRIFLIFSREVSLEGPPGGRRQVSKSR